LFGITDSGARTRLVQPLVDRGFAVESPSGTLAPTEFGTRVTGPVLEDPRVRRDVAATLDELAWCRSES
jgi:hypothetical protein